MTIFKDPEFLRMLGLSALSGVLVYWAVILYFHKCFPVRSDAFAIVFATLISGIIYMLIVKQMITAGNFGEAKAPRYISFLSTAWVIVLSLLWASTRYLNWRKQ